MKSTERFCHNNVLDCYIVLHRRFLRVEPEPPCVATEAVALLGNAFKPSPPRLEKSFPVTSICPICIHPLPSTTHSRHTTHTANTTSATVHIPNPHSQTPTTLFSPAPQIRSPLQTLLHQTCAVVGTSKRSAPRPGTKRLGPKTSSDLVQPTLTPYQDRGL